MQCEHFEIHIDSYIDRDVDASILQELDEHVAACSQCQQYVSSHRQYMKKMAACRPDHSTGARAMNLLKNTVEDQAILNHKHHQRHAFTQGFAAASVLAFAFFIGFSFMFIESDKSMDLVFETVDDNILDKNSEVTIVILAPKDMSNAMLSFALPEGLEIEGHEGFGFVEWPVSLKAGVNTLTLPVVNYSISASATKIHAALSFEEEYREFSLDVNLVPEYKGQKDQGAKTTPSIVIKQSV